MKEIEVYIGYDGGVWDTKLIEIPTANPNELNESDLLALVVEQYCEKDPRCCEPPDIVFCGLYNENPLEEEYELP